MASDEPSAEERRITTDRKQIEEWASEHDAVPVSENGDPHLVPKDEASADRYDRLDWDEFYDQLDREEMVVIHRGHGEGERFEVAEQDVAAGRLDLEKEEIEERLLAGEVVTGTVTETTVVERTVLEEAQVKSEVVGREIVDEQLLDVELLSRECDSCAVGELGEEGYTERYGHGYFLSADERLAVSEEYPLTLEAEIDEGWSLTVEQLEELTVESRVTDVHVSETDTVEDVDVRSDLGVEAIHRHLFESDIFEGGPTAETVDADAHAIDTEFGEGDVVTTTLTRHRTIDREVGMRHRVSADVVEGELLDANTVTENIVESGVAEREAALGGEGAGVSTGATTETGTQTPTEDDAGKPVVGPTGGEIGMVSAVEDGVAYVDPEPGLAEKIMAKLGWGGVDEDDYPLRPEKISRITDDAVEIVAEE